jgi:SAM-dependent methyltransferase
MTTTAQEFWEDFYQERDQVWSGKPNGLLVRVVFGLTPETALDLGCGEGGDAIWLARQGWRVTAVDVSSIALNRAADHATEAGVAVTWERHDLTESFPAGQFALVSAQFLHSPVAPPGEREAILRQAANAVAPNGRLLIAGHAGWPTWMTEPPFDFPFPTIPEVLDALNLPEGEWTVETADVIHEDHTSPEGREGQRSNNIIRLHRAG